MKSNLDFVTTTILMCLLFLASFIVSMCLMVKIDNLESVVARQQVQIEHQALDLMILKGK